MQKTATKSRTGGTKTRGWKYQNLKSLDEEPAERKLGPPRRGSARLASSGVSEEGAEGALRLAL